MSEEIEVDTDEFARDLAKAAAKQLARVAKKHGKVTVNELYRLQDATSLFSPYTFKHIMARLEQLGVKTVKNPFGLIGETK